MSIRDSPYLSLGVVDSALRAVQDPNERVQLLGARVHLLQAELDAATASTQAQGDLASTSALTAGRASTEASDQAVTVQAPTAHAPAPAAAPSPLPLLSARLDLADARLNLHPPNVHAAEAECRVVEDTCKRLMKRAKRLARAACEAGGSGDGDGDGVNGVQQPVGVHAAATSVAEASASEESEAWLADVRSLRARAQRTLFRVEEALGRPGRADRARALAEELDQPVPDTAS